MDTKEIITQIGLYLYRVDIYTLFTVNKTYKQTLCDDQHFWKLKCLHDFGNISNNIGYGKDWKLLYFTYIPQRPQIPRSAQLTYFFDNKKRLTKENPIPRSSCLSQIAEQE